MEKLPERALNSGTSGPEYLSVCVYMHVCVHVCGTLPQVTK